MLSCQSLIDQKTEDDELENQEDCGMDDDDQGFDEDQNDYTNRIGGYFDWNYRDYDDDFWTPPLMILMTSLLVPHQSSVLKPATTKLRLPRTQTDQIPQANLDN